MLIETLATYVKDIPAEHYSEFRLKRKMTPEEYKKYVNTAIDHTTYGYKEEDEIMPAQQAEEKSEEITAEASGM
jgi:hypothetical protein